MARRGWVSAQTGPGQWRRLMVFDDGWVELPGLARAMSDTRSKLKRSVLLLVAVVGALVAILGISRLLATFDGSPPIVWAIPGVLLVAIIVVVTAVFIRWSIRDIRQLDGDVEQARDERRRGMRITAVPGAPRFRRAESAAQFAGWLDGETHVAVSDISAVEVHREGRDHVIAVRFVDGPTRTYRSPDDKLVELLAGSARPA